MSPTNSSLDAAKQLEAKDAHAISFAFGNLNASTNHQTMRAVVEAQYYKLRLEKLRRAVIEFKCPTCEGERSINIYGAGWKKAIIGSRPCPTCTLLHEALEGLTK